CTLQDGTAYDEYSFVGTAGQQITLTLNGTAPLDAYLILLAPDGVDIAEDDNGGGGTNARIPATTGFATLPQTGTYLVFANSAGTGQFGSYTLNLSVATTNCPSTPISTGQIVGALAASDCRLPADGSFIDVYTFNGAAGQQIAIFMSSTDFDAFLFLLSPTGTDIADDDNSGGGTNARIPGVSGFFTLPVTGTYTIYANSALPNQTGNYMLSLLAPLPAGQVVISELRFEGPGNGGDPIADDFVELQNISASTADISGTKLRLDVGGGAANVVDVVIANGTVLQPGQHFLATNANAGSYSLGGYATGDQTYTANLAASVAFTLADNTVVDQVGRSLVPPVFSEGTPLSSVSGATTQNSFVRKLNAGLPQDTNNNATDFVLVAVAPAQMAGAVLGAPGPENRTSPVQRNATIKSSLIDNCGDTGTATPAGGCQNRVRLLTPDPLNPTLSPSGQLLIRRKFTNNTGTAVTRLRFRIVDATTAPAPGGQADLRALSSQDITVVRADGGGPVAVKGLTLEQPPAQPNGGGVNSSLLAGSVTTTPIANGASIAVEFRLGIMQGGAYRFFVNVEALP
ncbi:MAG: pre-peptidase C-terminal domain-containing protein, partial [Pyrinomonadaceae bacterium]